MTSPGRRRITHKVWRGVLMMWRNPKIIQALQSDEPLMRMTDHKIQQQEVDCVLRAVDWAKALEDKHK